MSSVMRVWPLALCLAWLVGCPSADDDDTWMDDDSLDDDTTGDDDDDADPADDDAVIGEPETGGCSCGCGSRNAGVQALFLLGLGLWWRGRR